MKYSKKIVNKIIELYSTGKHSIQQICDSVGITRETFYDWKEKRAEFKEKIEQAEPVRLDQLKEMAITGLAILLQGKEYEEVTTEYVEGKPDATGNTKPKIRFQRKIKKFILPNPTSVIFALKNLDEDNFRDIIKQEHSGRDGSSLALPVINVNVLPTKENLDE